MPAETSEFIGLADAANRVGVNQRTLVHHITREGIPLYVAPLNRKRRLVHVDDLTKLATPQPLPRQEATA